MRIERARLRAEYLAERTQVARSASEVAGKEFRVAFREQHGVAFDKFVKQAERELRTLEHELHRLSKAERDAERDMREAVVALLDS